MMNTPFRIGILARLSKEKNHAFFLELVKAMRNEKNIHFYIAGDGPLKEEINRKIQEHGLDPLITCLGNVEQPAKFLSTMDVLVVPSHREVFPMAILEAMATGTNVVAINRGGIEEMIIDGKTGHLMGSHDVNMFKSRILSLRNNDMMRLLQAEHARKFIENNFTVEKMVEHTHEQYDRAIENAKHTVDTYEGLGKNYESRR
ncbi:glycosyltransferase [Geomicrobium sp. JCM 19039]|nr:glycosyltransferase [Geomicrobium sp. JCM 19039]